MPTPLSGLLMLWWEMAGDKQVVFHRGWAMASSSQISSVPHTAGLLCHFCGLVPQNHQSCYIS